MCIRSVFILTSECTALTVTLVVTLRKFLSLLISIAFFNNPFSVLHWLGTVLVFVGTVLFADVFAGISGKVTQKADVVADLKAGKSE